MLRAVLPQATYRHIKYRVLALHPDLADLHKGKDKGKGKDNHQLCELHSLE